MSFYAFNFSKLVWTYISYIYITQACDFFKDETCLSNNLFRWVTCHLKISICYSLLRNKSGDRFSCAAFSAHLKQVIYGLTGKLAGVQVLRSAFLMQCDHELRNLSSE